jgi:hypothetical protein
MVTDCDTDISSVRELDGVTEAVNEGDVVPDLIGLGELLAETS